MQKLTAGLVDTSEPVTSRFMLTKTTNRQTMLKTGPMFIWFHEIFIPVRFLRSTVNCGPLVDPPRHISGSIVRRRLGGLFYHVAVQELGRLHIHELELIDVPADTNCSTVARRELHDILGFCAEFFLKRRFSRPFERTTGQAANLLKRSSIRKITERSLMLYTIAVLLILFWLLGLVSAYTIHGFIHVLLVIAIIVLLVRMIEGRRPL